MGTLLFSISGLRGIVGSGLTPEIITEYAAAYGSFLKQGKIVVGRDTRASGDMIKHAVLAGLLSSGCEVIDLGIVPTPTINLIVRETRCQGGLAITASHNPIEWNALKFITNEGVFLAGTQADNFLAFVKKGDFRRASWEEIKSITCQPNSIDIHIDKILDSKIIEWRSRKLKVGVDGVNGAGSLAIPQLLKRMGVEVFPIFCTPDGNFPRPPEPVDESLDVLKRLVKEKHLDLGLAVDPDCDRLSIVDEEGRAIGEEKTLVLASKYILARKKGAVVTNLSTTRLMDDIAGQFGTTLYRTRVGEANVVEKMREVGAVIGGEGNGGVIIPEMNLTRDAMVGAALIISLLCSEDKKLSEICKDLPNYFMVKKKMAVKGWNEKTGRINAYLSNHEVFKNGERDTSDGIKFVGGKTWIHIRSSQTEPIVRIIGESDNQVVLRKLIDEVTRLCAA